MKTFALSSTDLSALEGDLHQPGLEVQALAELAHGAAAVVPQVGLALRGEGVERIRLRGRAPGAQRREGVWRCPAVPDAASAHTASAASATVAPATFAAVAVALAGAAAGTRMLASADAERMVL